MRTIKHPLSGAIYDLTERGTILVQKDAASGEFTSDGVWIRGDIKQADPHLCLWIGGKQPVVGQVPNGQSAKGMAS
jgi:hypothetical protein